MARILCVWEQGSHLGHLSNLRLPIEIALQLGHQVFLVARELHRVQEVLTGLSITYLQAPFKQNVAPADQSAIPSYTHLLVRQCFSGVDELEMYVRAWRALFDLVRPGLVLFEHSPTALIAAHAYDFNKVLIGNGFCIPPTAPGPSEPFAPFVTTPRTADVVAGLRADDTVLLHVINTALQRLGAGNLTALSDIYAQADEQFLMTVPMLDHFGERPAQRYLGHFPPRVQTPPQWPPGSGSKVFGYLQAFPSLEQLLQALQQADVCALLHIRGLPPALKATYTSGQLHFTDQLIDLTRIAGQASWVINHGNHSTVAHFARAGIPQLMIPLHQEHLFGILRMATQGCAILAYQDQGSYAKEIATLLSGSQLRHGAAQLQAHWPSQDALDAAGFMRHTFRRLLPGDPG